LDRNAFQRLGSKDDVNEIVNHPFFAGVNFADMLEKKIESPFKPALEQYTFNEDKVDV